MLAATNWKQNIKPEPLDKLRAQGSLPQNVTGSLKLFLDVRNKLIHSSASDDELFRAIDSGLTILRAINAIPVEVNVIYQTNVPLYSDANCAQRIPGVVGVILETTSPGGSSRSHRIFPTTSSANFEKGKRVAWDSNFSNVWGPTWYRDPTTDETLQAWLSSCEFLVRYLDDGVKDDEF